MLDATDPEQVITDLWANPRALAAAGPRLSPRERDVLERPTGQPWTVSDVPLLDEAAELLGEDDEPARRAAAIAASDRAREEEYARGVLEMTGVAGLTAGALIDRYSGSRRVRRTVVDAALDDRTWVFGHVVVDEAQELSPMQWRLLLRRCPSRSMTVVGDLAQAGSAAAPRTWGDAFDRVAPGPLVGRAADGQLPDARSNDAAGHPRPSGLGQCRHGALVDP